MRLGNWIGRPLARSLRLDGDRLLEEASRRTGLNDFGDGSFREPFEVLLAAYRDEARLTLAGRAAIRTSTRQLLAHRLRFEAYRRRYPEIAAEKIRAPLFILSLSRAGTTLLHRLLAQDHANRTPRTWELMYPFPPPESTTYDTDPRIAKAEHDLRLFERFLAPRLRRVHELGARLPEECLMIMAPSFRSFEFPSMAFVPSYQRWMENNDLGPGYAYHRRVLQHLQWHHRGERWVLKAPAHVFGIEEIFATYPDAGIIHLHRDPLEVTASLASLTLAIYSAFAEPDDPTPIVRELVETLHTGVDRYCRAFDRDPARQRRFLDVHYREITADPIATVRRIYEHFGLRLGDRAETRMRRFLADNPQGKHGTHRYSLEQFGIDGKAEAERFQSYRRRFGLNG